LLNGGLILAVLSSQQRSETSSSVGSGDVKRILGLEVPVIVRLAERRLLLSEVMRLGTGAIIEFFKRSDEPLELLVNNKVIGVGETVKVGENFGIRITQIGDVKQVIAALGNPRS
jgi:flagellar motor switch protein FliN/FliY